MPILEVKELKAYYITEKYGRLYGLKLLMVSPFKSIKMRFIDCRESGCGKSTLLKAISGLIKPH